jgi:hypothetical protein
VEAISERSPPNDPTLDQLLMTFHLRSVRCIVQYGEDLASQQMVVGPNGPKTGIPFLLRPRMNLLFEEIRRNPLLWLLAFVPVVFVAHMCLIAVILAVTSFGATHHKSCAAVRPVNYVGTKSLRTTVVTRCTNDT